MFAGRRNGAKLEPLVKEIEKAGGEIHARSLDARKEEEIISFLGDADKHAPLEVCIFNIGANVNFPILDTTERVFRKVWEMACYSGFLAGREAARLMLPRGKGNIFFTGATASLRGGTGYAAFASAKFGLRAVAQATARELGPKNIHVAHLIIDFGVDTEWVRQRRIEALGPNALDNPDLLMPPSSVRSRTGCFISSPGAPGPLNWRFVCSARSGSGPFQTPAVSCPGLLRDRNDLKLLIRCVDFIADSLAHQNPCHRGHEGNGAGSRVRLVLSDDMIFLYAPIAAPEGHRAAEGDSVGRRRIGDDLSGPSLAAK